jgi:hypothetical protein
MARTPYHNEPDIDLEAIDTGIDNDRYASLLEQVVSQSKPDGETIELNELLGERTLEDGGVLGGMLELIRNHINFMLKNNELTEDAAGQVYSACVQQAFGGSIDFLTKQFELKQIDKDKTTSLIQQAMDIKRKMIDNEAAKISKLQAEYNLEVLSPLDTEMKTEQIEQMHVDHQIGQYKLNTLLPDEHMAHEKEALISQYRLDTLLPDEHLERAKRLALLDYDLATLKPDEHKANVTENATREYYRTDMQPEEKLTLVANRELAQANTELKEKEVTLAEKNIGLAEKELLLKEKEIEIRAKEVEAKTYEVEHLLPVEVQLKSAQTCLANTDCEIKTYYKQHIQPIEKDIASWKEDQEKVNAGSGTLGNSLPAKKLEQLAKQTELYERQRLSYDDTKYLRLLETQVNFAGIIFADSDTPDPLTAFATNSAVNNTYQAVKP